jgi:hypothetical protein
MKTILPNDKAYDKRSKEGYSLFSDRHCCICGKEVKNESKWLLLARKFDGTYEYAISEARDADFEDLKANGLWIAPIGLNCLRKYPELKHAIIFNLRNDI